MQKEDQDDKVKSGDSDQETIELIQEVKQELSDYRKQFDKYWDQYDDAYYGKQHKTGEGQKTVKNHIFKTVEISVPILTDSLPGVGLLAESEDRQDDALVLEKSIKYVFNDQNLQLKLPSLMRSALKSAPGYLYVYYDPDAKNGEGAVRYKELPRKSVYLDGNVSYIEDSAKAVVEIPMRRDEVARIFPNKKDAILKKEGDDKEKYGQEDGSFETRDVSGRELKNQGAPKKHKAKDIIDYVETWVKSYDLMPIPPEDTHEQLEEEHKQLLSGQAPDISKWEDHRAHIEAHTQARAELLGQLGLPPETSFDDAMAYVDQLKMQNPEMDVGPILMGIKITDNHLEEHNHMLELNPTSEMPKYVDGWRVIKSVEDIILYDGPNPEAHKDNDCGIPIVPFYCYKDETIYGFGEIKNILDPQRTLNTVDDYEYQNLKRNGNSGWVVDHESQVDEKKLTNAPGLVIKKAKGTEVRRLEPGTVSPQFQSRKQNDAMDIRDISGNNEATEGRIPSASASGAAITSLQTQAVGRIRLKDRMLQHYSIKRLAKLTGILILNNWSTEKRLRLNTDSASAEELVFDPLRMRDLAYTIEIAPGSMAGIDKEALNAYYLRLLEGQHMPYEDFLAVADFPKREVLVKRLMERQQAQAEQEQMAMQQQQEMQAQQSNDQMMMQQQQMMDLHKENLKLKAAISPHLLSGQETKALNDVSRQEVINNITGNVAAPNGQANNQGNINV